MPALALVTLLLALAVAPADARRLPEQGRWKREGVVNPDPSTFNNPDVVALEDGTLRAYYMAMAGIRSAVSADGGRTWTDDPGTRVLGSHHAVVRLADGRLRMYHSASGPDGGPVLSAISDDGLAFVAEDGVRLEPGAAGEPDAKAMIHPSVVRLPDGSFRMYYDAQSPTEGQFDLGWKGVMSASSPDGLVWTKDAGFRVKAGKGGVPFADLVWSPFVELENGLWKLYFSVETESAGKVGVYLATSSDGVRFRVQAKRVLAREPRVGPPSLGQGGMNGLPQDVVLFAVPGGKRALYWLARKGTYSAFLRVR